MSGTKKPADICLSVAQQILTDYRQYYYEFHTGKIDLSPMKICALVCDTNIDCTERCKETWSFGGYTPESECDWDCGEVCIGKCVERYEEWKHWIFNEMRINVYHGNYGGYEMVEMTGGGGADAGRAMFIEGYRIGTRTLNIFSEPLFYKDGIFYIFEEAYDSGLIAAKDVYEIGSKIGFAE